MQVDDYYINALALNCCGIAVHPVQRFQPEIPSVDFKKKKKEKKKLPSD